MSTTTRRARSQQQKAEREERILDTAAQLFSSRSYQAVTLADVAAGVGITKAALYRYFPGKELLFLALYRREIDRWMEQVARQGMPSLDGSAIIDELLARPLFCRLSAILHIALEAGLSEEQARDFKQFLYQRMNLAATLVAQLSGRTLQQSFRFLLRCQQAIIGCWHLTHRSATMERVLSRAPLDEFRLDFADTLRQHLDILLTDFIANDR